MIKPAVLVCAAVSMLLAPGGRPMAEPLGRLFLTPEQRQSLDRQRRDYLVESAAADAGALSIDGVVTRSAGGGTVWINRRPYPDRSMERGLSVTLKREAAETVVLVGSGRRAARLKVGERIDAASGEITNRLRDGRVLVVHGR